MNHVSALRPPLPSLLTKAHSSRHLLSPEAHLPLCLPPHLMEGVFPAPSQDSCLNFCFPWIPPLTSHSARWAWIAPLIGPCLYSGGENGNPLQYSYVENPMDRGAWRATNHGVPNGQSQLSNWARIVLREWVKVDIPACASWLCRLLAVWPLANQLTFYTSMRTKMS